MKKLRSEKFQKWLAVTIAILSLSVFTLSILSYTIDQDGTIIPFTTVVLLASMVSFAFGVYLTLRASSKMKELEDNSDDNYTRVDNDAGGWNENNRLG